MLNCSEGSRGLSVPMQETGIFTGATISPSSWLRQYPDRYTIRAGRNLPDKEFRYLRTVLVCYYSEMNYFGMIPAFTGILNIAAEDGLYHPSD